MQRYIIERTLTDAGQLNNNQLRDIARTSNAVIRGMGPGIQWLQTYVTANKLTCVYLADNAEILVEHAKRGGFPCDNIMEVATVFDPLTERVPAKA
jgi:hypothetical protein